MAPNTTTTPTPKPHSILFRLFYSTSFTLFFLLLIAFICISPADSLYQSYKRRRLLDIIFIAAVYFLTALLAALIYASRLYTTRSELKDIPKTYIPLDKAELPGKKTWVLVRETVRRSAVLALLTRPRARRVEVEEDGTGDEDDEQGGAVSRERVVGLLRPELRRNEGDGDDEERLIVRGHERWGPIAHEGWSSPANKDLPDLQYETVVGELVDLIEAKAVSLAPVDVVATAAQEGLEEGERTPVPDPRVIEALTRPDNVGMRAYVGRLIAMEVLDAGELTTAFLTLYERARFAVRPLSDVEFKNLMRLFAELLRCMRQVNVDLIDLDNLSDSHGYGYADDNGDVESVDRKSFANSHFSSASSISGSVRRHAKASPRRASEGSMSGSVRVKSRGDG